MNQTTEFNGGCKLAAILYISVILLLNGCMTEGRISDHTFEVLTNRGKNTPTPTALFHDLDTFALSQGFVSQSPLSASFKQTTATSSGVFYVLYLNNKGGAIMLSAHSSLKAKAVLVSIAGPRGKLYQRATDATYAFFLQQFSKKYGPGAISDVWYFDTVKHGRRVSVAVRPRQEQGNN